MAQPAYGARYCIGAGSVGSGGDDDGVLHRAVLLEHADHLGDRGRLLADGDVDADQVAALLVDDRVDRDARLAGLSGRR